MALTALMWSRLAPAWPAMPSAPAAIPVKARPQQASTVERARR